MRLLTRFNSFAVCRPGRSSGIDPRRIGNLRHGVSVPIGASNMAQGFLGFLGFLEDSAGFLRFLEEGGIPVDRWPKDRMTELSSGTVMSPSSSLSISMKASLKSATCSSVNPCSLCDQDPFQY